MKIPHDINTPYSRDGFAVAAYRCSIQLVCYLDGELDNAAVRELRTLPTFVTCSACSILFQNVFDLVGMPQINLASTSLRNYVTARSMAPFAIVDLVFDNIHPRSAFHVVALCDLRAENEVCLFLRNKSRQGTAES